MKNKISIEKEHNSKMMAGAMIGFIFPFILCLLAFCILSFVAWENFFSLFDITKLFFLRAGVLTGLLGAIIGRYW